MEHVNSSQVAHLLRTNVVGHPTLNSQTQWGIVAAVHRASDETTLAAAAAAGALTIQTNGPLTPNAQVFVDGATQATAVTALSGTQAPYTVTLQTPLLAAAPSGATVRVANTVDLYLDGTQNLGDEAYLTPGVRFYDSFVPEVGDVVHVLRGTGASATDRVCAGRPMAGHGGPLVTIGTTAGAPTTGTWRAGMLYLDTGNALLVCTTSGTPGTWSSPVTVAGAPLRGSPAGAAGLLVATSQTVVEPSVLTPVQLQEARWLSGGMARSDDGLVAPADGLYEITWQITWHSGGGPVPPGDYRAGPVADRVPLSTACTQAESSQFVVVSGSLPCPLVAGQTVGLTGFQASPDPQACAYEGVPLPGYGTFLSAHLVTASDRPRTTP